MNRIIKLENTTKYIDDRVNYTMKSDIHVYLTVKSYGIVTLVHLSNIYTYANDEHIKKNKAAPVKALLVCTFNVYLRRLTSESRIPS